MLYRVTVLRATDEAIPVRVFMLTIPRCKIYRAPTVDKVSAGKLDQPRPAFPSLSSIVHVSDVAQPNISESTKLIVSIFTRSLLHFN